jgi:hypothetical protein
MRILSRLFGDPTKQQLKQHLIELRQDVERRTGPLAQLSLAIVKAADACSKALKSSVAEQDQPKKQEREIYLFYEFIYFFMHLTMRSAFAHLSEPQIMKLQKFLAPVIAGAAIDSFFLDCPVDLKRKMRSEFYQNLNNAELEYATSKELIPKSFRPITGNSLIEKLARNVTQIVADNTDIAIMMAVIEVSMSVRRDTKLDQLVSAASSALNELSDDEIAALADGADRARL